MLKWGEVESRHFLNFFNFFFKNKNLVLNAQVSFDIGKRQLPVNGAKNLLGKF